MSDSGHVIGENNPHHPNYVYHRHLGELPSENVNHPELPLQPLAYSTHGDYCFTLDTLSLRKSFNKDGVKYIQFIQIRKEDIPTLLDALRATFGKDIVK